MRQQWYYECNFGRCNPYLTSILQPETALNGDGPPQIIIPGAAGQNTLVVSAAGAAGALAGWAMGSLTKKAWLSIRYCLAHANSLNSLCRVIFRAPCLLRPSQRTDQPQHLPLHLLRSSSLPHRLRQHQPYHHLESSNRPQLQHL